MSGLYRNHGVKAMRRTHSLSRVCTAILSSLCLLLLDPNSAQAQCDWSKKILDAIQRRYQTNENACKALLALPAEFNQAHALLENEMLSHLQFVTVPELDSWLQQHSQKMLSQVDTQPGQQTSAGGGQLRI
jgi:hypothetical protein